MQLSLGTNLINKQKGTLELVQTLEVFFCFFCFFLPVPGGSFGADWLCLGGLHLSSFPPRGLVVGLGSRVRLRFLLLGCIWSLVLGFGVVLSSFVWFRCTVVTLCPSVAPVFRLSAFPALLGSPCCFCCWLGLGWLGGVWGQCACPGCCGRAIHMPTLLG